MVIQNAAVTMSSVHTGVSLRMNAVSSTGWGGVLKDTGYTASTTPSAMDSEQTKTNASSITAGRELLKALDRNSAQKANSLFVTEDDAEYEGNIKVEYDSLKNLFQLMSSSEKVTAKKVTTIDIFQQLMSNFRERLEKIVRNLGRNSGMNIIGITSTGPTEQWTVEEKTFDMYMESESTTYSSAGKVSVADGRELEFDISAVMSRSFCEYTNVEINYNVYTMVDPLVISLTEGAAEVTDQKFLFDIDADGELDNISLLAENCGYLALDKNADGVINDGSELFGTESGDGFGELAVFDMDGNGWIDEKDEIFNRLRIWTKDKEGRDKLVALGIAGIGAIYLGNIQTEFMLNSESSNRTNAQVRKTGIYLTEDGNAGLIQHIDMAVS